VLETQGTYHSRSAGELRDVVASLNDVLPKLRAAREQLARTEIRSPATGTVVGLTVFTPGGVIAAGEKLMDVVPDRMPLAIEARISPNDADDIQVGQLAFVRFDALHERTLPPLEGHVTRLSADVFTDEKTGTSFYTAEISIPHEALTAIRDVRGAKFEFRSGMPVSVQMPLRRRTALQYALEPLTAATRDSFSEH
jgi:HlyD family secretion protein